MPQNMYLFLVVFASISGFPLWNLSHLYFEWHGVEKEGPFSFPREHLHVIQPQKNTLMTRTKDLGMRNKKWTEGKKFKSIIVWEQFGDVSCHFLEFLCSKFANLPPISINHRPWGSRSIQILAAFAWVSSMPWHCMEAPVVLRSLFLDSDRKQIHPVWFNLDSCVHLLHNDCCWVTRVGTSQCLRTFSLNKCLPCWSTLSCKGRSWNP